MQLTELLFQKVKDLPTDGQLSLKPGYVAVVSKAASLRAALIAPLCPAPDDPKLLTNGANNRNEDATASPLVNFQIVATQHGVRPDDANN